MARSFLISGGSRFRVTRSVLAPRCTRAALVAVYPDPGHLTVPHYRSRQAMSDLSDCYGSQHTRWKSVIALRRCRSAALVAVSCRRRVHVTVTDSARQHMGRSDFSPLTGRTYSVYRYSCRLAPSAFLLHLCVCAHLCIWSQLERRGGGSVVDP